MERIGIFEEIFSTEKNLRERKIWLYGLNDETKRACSMLSYFDIPIEGFIIEEDYKNHTGDEYLGKPIKTVSEYECCRNSCLMDIFGENVERVKEICGEENILFDFRQKKIILYGAGDCGKIAVKFLKKTNGDIVFICDRQYERIKSIYDLPVVSPEEIVNFSPTPPFTINDYLIVVAINDEKISDELCGKYKKMGYNCAYFNSIFFERMYTRSIWMPLSGRYMPVFKACCLRYINKIAKKKVFLYSSNDDYTRRVVKRLKCLGFTFGRVIFDKLKNNIQLYKADGKLIENYSDKYIVWVLSGYESDAKAVFRDIDTSISVLYSINAPCKLAREYILDTHLGFGNKNSPQKIFNLVKGKRLRVAVLGESTADINLLEEKSWPEYFLEEATAHGISCELICASTTGYTSLQTLIQLERDIIPCKPNVVVGYNIVNDAYSTGSTFGQAHLYQKYIFDLLNKTNAEISLFGLKRQYDDIRMGTNNRSTAERWLDNNRMMNAICMEYDIKFYAFIPPVLFTKEPKSRLDMELLEYLRDYSEMVNLIHEVQKMSERYKWIYDLTKVFNGADDETFFDHCHVVEEKNKVLAKEIMKTIIVGLKN